MTTVAPSVPVPSPGKETVSFGQRMQRAYLEAALFTLVQLGEVARETRLLNRRGAVLAYERSLARETELRGWVDRFKALAQLLEDRELI